jgi:hypothetical protein
VEHRLIRGNTRVAAVGLQRRSGGLGAVGAAFGGTKG